MTPNLQRCLITAVCLFVAAAAAETAAASGTAAGGTGVSDPAAARNGHRSTDDTVRCNRLLSQAMADLYREPARAEGARHRAELIAKQRSYLRGEAVAALLRGMATGLEGHSSEALAQLRDALVFVPRLGVDSVAAAIHFQLGEAALMLMKLDSALLHLSEAERIWTLCRDADGRAQAIHLRGVLADFMNRPAMRDSAFQQLRALYVDEGNPLARLFAMSMEVEQIMSAGDLDSAMQLCLDGLRLCDEAGEQQTAAAFYLLLGNIHSRAGRYGPAVACFQRAITINREHHDRRFLYSSMNNLAVIYYEQGDYRNAIAVLLEAKDIAGEIGNPSAQTAALDNLGLIYAETGEEAKAMRSFHESLAIGARSGLPNQNRVTNLNIGLLFMERGQPDSAIVYYRRAVETARAVGKEYDIAESLMHLGDAQLALLRLSEAQSSYERSLALMERTGVMRGIAEALLHFADADTAAGRIGDAIARSERALAIADSTGALTLEADALRRLTRLYEVAGDPRMAYDTHVRYAAVRDSMLSAENMKRLRELSARYEAEQREKEIAMHRRDLTLKDLDLARQQEELLRRRIDARRRAQKIALLEKQGEIEKLEQDQTEAELARQRSEAERQKQQAELLQTRNRLQGAQLEQATVNRNSILGGMAVLIVITVLLFRRYRERKRSGEEIARTLEELRRTQDQLIHAEKMGTLGEMTAGIAHEIRNPMNFISNFAQVARELADEARMAAADDGEELPSTLEQLEAAAEKISEHSRRAESIVAGMLMHARSQAGVREARELNPVIEEYIGLVWQGFRVQHPDTEVRVEFVPGKDVGTVEMIPQEIARVIMNVVQNALQAVTEKKRTAPEEYEPHVHVSTYRIVSGAEIRVFDNGPGIPPELRNKIFQPFFTTKTTGEGTGLGLSMAYDIVVKGHGGSIDFTSRPGQGTTFIIRLPGEEEA